MAVPMDVDEDFSSHRVNLIRAVRTIDEDASTSIPAKIHKLWLLLSASKSSRLHGVEETVLRWLCKHMTGTTEDAELARRYPLSWAVLAYTFRKIPPQALGKSLADRKFITILRQTLDEVSKPAGDADEEVKSDGQKSCKRKRAMAMPDNLTELRAMPGCIRSSVNIFEALDVLLGYGYQTTELTSPQDKVGLEHIKSLFSSSSEETRDITSRLLWCCQHVLRGLDGLISHEQESWVGIASAVWDLRLHSINDTYEFARYLYSPVCSILGTLNSRPGLTNTERIWARQLEQLLGTSFIRPARHIFAQDGNVQNLKSALEITSSDSLTSTNVLWNAASRTPRDQTDPKSKAEHAAWVNTVFSAVLGALEPSPRTDQNEAIANLLATAVTTRSVPDSETLRQVTSKNAFQEGSPDWQLIGQVIACDPDVFLADTVAEDMLFDKATAQGSTDEQNKDVIVKNVILPLMEASARARDLTGFVRRWHQSLCKFVDAQDKKTWSSSLWIDPRIRQQLANILQTSLSITQVLRLFEFLATPDSNPTALLVVLDGICGGISDEDYVAAIDSKVFSAAFQDKKYKKLPSEILALHWRIAGYMAAWEKSEDLCRLWEEVKSSLKKTLKSGDLTDADTLEAFRCCQQMWLASYHGGKYEDDAAKLTCLFLKRLLPELASLDSSSVIDRYMDIVLSSLPRLTELGGGAAPELMGMLKSAFFQVCKQTIEADTMSPSLSTHIQSLLSSDAEDQESFLDAILSQLLDLLDGAENEIKPSDEQPWNLPVVQILEEFPTESWTRTRRKRLLTSWKKSRSLIASRSAEETVYGAAVLRLLVNVAQQPTFYDGMDFGDLLSVASLQGHGQQDMTVLAGRFTDITLRHLAESTEQVSAEYLKAASDYVGGLDTKHLSPRDFVLLKSLASAAQSSHLKTRGSVIDLDEVLYKLRDAVRHGLTDIDKKLQGITPSQTDDIELVTEDRSDLKIILDAVDSLPDPLEPIKLPKGNELEETSNRLITSGCSLGWKLKKFLVRNNPGFYSNYALVDHLDRSSSEAAEKSINDFLAAFTNIRDHDTQARLVDSCLARSHKTRSTGPLIAVRNIVERMPVLHGAPLSSDERTFNSPHIHREAATLLKRVTSLGQFKQLSEIMVLLLDKHSASMTQFSIELTLNTVAEVASANGPDIQDSKGAGEIYESLYRLVATVIRRHRRRLEGHFPVLVATLQALLRVLLADPLACGTASSSSSSSSAQALPPWLGTRLRARHGARFARLVTLVCEPSAAAVARSRRSTTASAATTMLDSATDAAKRSAGQDMFHVVELYIKLQLEVVVPQDVRKALEPGVYSVLNITPEGCRRVMNESLDVNGRAVFREMFAAYKKFGRWSGV